MTIQKKFFIFVIINVLSFSAAIGLYLIISAPVTQMADETDKLISLTYQIRDLRSEISRLDNNSFKQQIAIVQLAKAKMYSSFEEVRNLKVLPEADISIRRSIDTIMNLQALFDSNWKILEGQLETMQRYVVKVLLTDGTIVSAERMNLYASRTVRADGTLDSALSTWSYIQSYMSILDNNLSSAALMVDRQFESIEVQVARIRKTAVTVAVVIIAAMVLVVFIVFSGFTRGIINSIRAIERGINRLFSGDLTVRVHSRSRDELGRLSGELNHFIQELREGLKGIKISAEENLEVKNQLTSVVGETSGQVRQIETGTGKIQEMMGGLNSSVERSSSAVQVLGNTLSRIEDQILNQLSMVEESSSAVTEMIASIGNVSEITDKKGKATDILVETAANGGQQLGVTNRIIQDIHNSVDEISGTAAVIQNVASQTNLLAMNAAIEAAHAGEAGRGFAVVADEIRKLAETSSKNSKRISGVIKEVVSKIEEASVAGRKTQKAFQDIDLEVKGVSSSLKEITSNMAELNLGGQQILQAMSQLQEISHEVKNSSVDMNSASERLVSGIGNVVEIASEVRSGTEQIDDSVRDISRDIGSINTISQNLNQVSEMLNREVARYRTEGEEDDGDSAVTPEAGEEQAIGQGDSIHPESGKKVTGKPPKKRKKEKKRRSGEEQVSSGSADRDVPPPEEIPEAEEELFFEELPRVEE